VALPLFVVTVIVVGNELGLLKLTVKTAAVPSVTVTLLMLTVGATSSSLMVAVPVAAVLAVFVEVTVPLSVKFSVGSFVKSWVVGTITVTLVCPAGMVTVVVVVL
jgi:hypothetical protein